MINFPFFMYVILLINVGSLGIVFYTYLFFFPLNLIKVNSKFTLSILIIIMTVIFYLNYVPLISYFFKQINGLKFLSLFFYDSNCLIIIFLLILLLVLLLTIQKILFQYSPIVRLSFLSKIY